jgi:formylglycine-generating enzyme required for sulfatase activity
VLRATFEQAVTYCQAQNKRVPTPNEWVRAAGGDEERSHPWGDRWPKNIRNLCTGKGHPCDVGTSSLDVSQLGIRDMAVNAKEWVMGVRPGQDGSMGGADWRYCSMMTASISRDGWFAGIRCAATPAP